MPDVVKKPFAGCADELTVEEKLGEKAQEIIGNLPIGKAAEILTKIVVPTKVRKLEVCNDASQ